MKLFLVTQQEDASNYTATCAVFDTEYSARAYAANCLSYESNDRRYIISTLELNSIELFDPSDDFYPNSPSTI